MVNRSRAQDSLILHPVSRSTYCFIMPQSRSPTSKIHSLPLSQVCSFAFSDKISIFFRKDLHCPAFSAIIHVVADADVAQSVERILGKDEVAGSNPAISSTKNP